MDTEKSTPIPFPAVRRIKAFIHQRIPQIGLKTKITFLIILIVAGVLLLASYLDYHLARKDQIGLYLDRNLYIAKQIDASIPDQKMIHDLPHIRNEVEEKWLEVIVPLHSEITVIGGIRLVSTLNEAQSYLNKKRDRAIILTFSS